MTYQREGARGPFGSLAAHVNEIAADECVYDNADAEALQETAALLSDDNVARIARQQAILTDVDANDVRAAAARL